MRDDQNFKVLQRSFAFLPRADDAVNKFTHLAAHKNPRFVINELNVFDPTIRKRIFVLIDKFRIVCTLICYLLLGILEEFVAELLDLPNNQENLGNDVTDFPPSQATGRLLCVARGNPL